MNIFVEHDAAALAQLVGAARPTCDRIIVRYGDPSHILASVHFDNPLQEGWLLEVDSPGTTLVTWSGTMAERLFEHDPRNWSQIGRAALDRLCDELAPQLQRHGRHLCIHPHARHILSDVPSCRTFAAERCGSGSPFSLAFDPTSMLEPPMLTSLAEHLERQFETMGPTCAMMLLNDVQVRTDVAGDSYCTTAPWGHGVLPLDRVRSLLRACVPESTPIVLQARDIARQTEWLTE